MADQPALGFKPMSRAEAPYWAAEVAEMEPWRRLAISEAMLLAFLTASDSAVEHYRISCGKVPIGIISFQHGWLFGPYLKLLAISAQYRSNGAGKAALGWLEDRAHGAKATNVWLCVSAFNIDGRKFYERNGYAEVARLDDLVLADETELLYRKMIAGARRRSDAPV